MDLNAAPRLVALAAHDSDGYASRVQMPTTHLRHARPEWDVTAYLPDAVEIGVDINGALQTIKGIPDILSVDLLVVQQPNTRAGVELVQWASRVGIATVVDVVQRDEGLQDALVRRAADQADLVTVSERRLLRRYGGHGRAEICDADTNLDHWIGFWTRAVHRKAAMS